jgi:hypothetical protein
MSKAELAAYFYESPKQIERYIGDGMPYMGTGKQRRFPMPECKQWRDQYIRRQAELAAERKWKPVGEDEVRRARGRHELTNPALREFALAEEEARVAPLDVVERRAADVLDRLAAKLSGLGRYMGDAQQATTVVEAAVFLERIGEELRHAVRATADELRQERGEVS